jgi:hypothetical protein
MALNVPSNNEAPPLFSLAHHFQKAQPVDKPAPPENQMRRGLGEHNNQRL